MLKEQEQMLEKTLTTSDMLNGGTLNAKQQDTFVALVRKYSTLLPNVRFRRMTQPNEDIDKLHVGEPVTASAEENVATTVYAKPQFNKVSLIARKLRSQWNISTETLQANIEQEGIEDTLMAAFTERVATDMEHLAINGDATAYATGTDPNSLLLKRADGWYKQLKSAHVLDAAGAAISKGLLAAAKRELPKQYRGDPNLRWVISDTFVTDWEDTVSDRETAAGDGALGGRGVNSPLGIPFLQVPLIPDSKAINTNDVAEATPAYVVGIEQGPFTITASNRAMKLDIDNAGAVTFNLPLGTWDTVEIANAINTAMSARVAYDDGFGHLVLKSTTKGAASEVEIQTVANEAYQTLGLWDGVASLPLTYTGHAAAAYGDVPEGSFIILCNPKNLIFGLLDGTRIFSEFNKGYDRIETVMYNQVAMAIENLDAAVIIDNVRRRELF